MGWLKIQKLEYLESGTEFFYEIKKFLTCASYDTLRVFRFVAEVTFKLFKLALDLLSNFTFLLFLQQSKQDICCLQEVEYFNQLNLSSF